MVALVWTGTIPAPAIRSPREIPKTHLFLESYTTINQLARTVTIKIRAFWEFKGLTPYVGATLVVALVWAGTRPAPTIRSPREIPKTQNLYWEVTVAHINGIENMTVSQLRDEIQQGGKFVVYLYCVSLLIITFKRGSGIYFVPAGQSAVVKGLPFTLLSLLAGWWGIPWGPIFTLEALARNLQGGKDVTQEVMSALSRAQTKL